MEWNAFVETYHSASEVKQKQQVVSHVGKSCVVAYAAAASSYAVAAEGASLLFSAIHLHHHPLHHRHRRHHLCL